MATSDSDFEIQGASGAWIPLTLALPRDERGMPIPGAPKTIQEALASSDEDITASDRLSVHSVEDWSGGVGVDYHHAEVVYTRTPGYAMPAGQATTVTIPATNNSASPIVAIRQFGSDLFAAQTGTGSANTGRVIRSTDGGATWADSLNLAAGQYARDLISYDNGAGTQYLYASSCNAKDPDPGANGMLHRWNGAIWASTTAGVTYGTNSRQRMAIEFAVDQDGVGDWRLVVISGSKTVAWTRPGADPFDVSATAWIEGVRIRTGWNLLRIAAKRRHWWVTAQDGMFDLDEQGNSPNITNYTETLLHGANGLSAEALGEFVYTSLGQGLDRVYVGQGPVLQENIGQCAPGHLTRARTKWTHAWTTELTQDQGYIVDAVHNPSTLESGIFWGIPREKVGVETRNPLVWYGPEVVITGGYKVSAMRSMSPSNDDLRFFVAAFKDSSAPQLAWVSLPISGAPLDDLISGGKHKFATGTAVTFGSGTIQPVPKLAMLDAAFGDRAATKILHQHVIASEGLSITSAGNDGIGTKLILQDRADPAPGSTSYSSSVDITTSPLHSLIPGVVVAGSRLELLVQFISPNGAASPVKVGVLDAARTTAWKIAPTADVITLTVEYGANIPGHSNVTEDPRDTAWVADNLITLARGGRTTIRDRTNKRWTVKVHQSFPRTSTFHDGGGREQGRSVLAQLSVSVIAGPL